MRHRPTGWGDESGRVDGGRGDLRSADGGDSFTAHSWKEGETVCSVPAWLVVGCDDTAIVGASKCVGWMVDLSWWFRGAKRNAAGALFRMGDFVGSGATDGISAIEAEVGGGGDDRSRFGYDAIVRCGGRSEFGVVGW